jgi:hypothetical protein
MWFPLQTCDEEYRAVWGNWTVQTQKVSVDTRLCNETTVSLQDLPLQRLALPSFMTQGWDIIFLTIISLAFLEFVGLKFRNYAAEYVADI